MHSYLARTTGNEFGGIRDQIMSGSRRAYGYDRVTELARQGDPTTTLANADSYAVFALAVWFWDVPPEPPLAEGQTPRPPVVPNEAIVRALAAVGFIASLVVGQGGAGWFDGKHIDL
jgi:hypothetical protein